MCARVHHVVPHVRGGREEVRHLFARRCRVTVDDPCVRRATGGTSRRHEDLGLAVDEVGDGEGIPRASSPPQRRAAHHREPERDRRERVRHDDPEVVVEDDVAGGGQPLERGPVSASPSVSGGCAGLGERAIDREPQIFVVDGHFDFIARATTGYRRGMAPDSRPPRARTSGLDSTHQGRRRRRRVLRDHILADRGVDASPWRHGVARPCRGARRDAWRHLDGLRATARGRPLARTRRCGRRLRSAGLVGATTSTTRSSTAPTRDRTETGSWPCTSRRRSEVSAAVRCPRATALPGILPAMIIASTSSFVTSSLFTVPTRRLCSITLMRSDRSNTSWMSWLIRKMPMPSDFS